MHVTTMLKQEVVQYVSELLKHSAVTVRLLFWKKLQRNRKL